MNNSSTNNLENRIAYLDYLRVISTLFIIVLHFSSYGLYFVTSNSYEGIVLSSYLQLSTFAVPMFIIISGSLFLGKNISTKTIYTKYITKQLLFFIFWSLFYSLVYRLIQVILLKPVSFSISDIFSDAISRPYQLWFIPMIIGLYMLIPILKCITANKVALRYTILLSIVFGYILPQLINAIAIPTNNEAADGFGAFFIYFYQNINILPVIEYIFYFVLGYYLSTEQFSKSARITIYICGLGGMCAIMLNTILSTPILFTDLLRLLFICAFFILMRYKKNKYHYIDTLIACFSRLCTGTFALHVFFIDVLFSLFGLYALSFNPIISIPSLSLLVLFMSFAATWLISKIPFINRFIC